MRRCQTAHSVLAPIHAYSEWRHDTYSIINNILRPSIIIYINRDSSQRRDFRGEFRQPRVILALSFVGVGHVGGGNVYSQGETGMVEGLTQA